MLMVASCDKKRLQVTLDAPETKHGYGISTLFEAVQSNGRINLSVAEDHIDPYYYDDLEDFSKNIKQMVEIGESLIGALHQRKIWDTLKSRQFLFLFSYVVSRSKYEKKNYIYTLGGAEFDKMIEQYGMGVL